MMETTENERHPLCPYCEYDLTGIFDRFTMEYVRCPECGEEMKAHEVYLPPKDGDWTLARAARQTAGYLLRRGMVVLGILLANILLIEWLGAALTRMVRGFQFTIPGLLVTQLIFGIIAAKVIYKGFEDAAGYTGLLHPMLSFATIGAAALILRTVMPAVITLTHTPLDAVLFMAMGVAVIVIIHDYLNDI